LRNARDFLPSAWIRGQNAPIAEKCRQSLKPLAQHAHEQIAMTIHSIRRSLVIRSFLQVLLVLSAKSDFFSLRIQALQKKRRQSSVRPDNQIKKKIKSYRQAIVFKQIN
jgi:hypothetical protein